jgi:hypothetical protein
MRLARTRNGRQMCARKTPATGRRGAGCVWIKLQGMRNAENRPEKPCIAGEPDTEKLVCPVRWGGHRNLTWRQEKALGPVRPKVSFYTALGRVTIGEELCKRLTNWRRKRWKGTEHVSKAPDLEISRQVAV